MENQSIAIHTEAHITLTHISGGKAMRRKFRSYIRILIMIERTFKIEKITPEELAEEFCDMFADQ